MLLRRRTSPRLKPHLKEKLADIVWTSVYHLLSSDFAQQMETTNAKQLDVESTGLNMCIAERCLALQASSAGCSLERFHRGNTAELGLQPVPPSRPQLERSQQELLNHNSTMNFNQALPTRCSYLLIQAEIVDYYEMTENLRQKSKALPCLRSFAPTAHFHAGNASIRCSNMTLRFPINVKRPTEKTCDQYGARVSGGP